jgi:hypothetical protein
MKIIWQIDPEDVEKVRNLFEQQQNTPFVKMRIRRNLAKDKLPITVDEFWCVMVGCLLTTQQRSGPETPVSRFLLTKPFPLNLDLCRQQKDLAAYAKGVLADFGGIRRSTMIGEEMAVNLAFLNTGGWERIFEHLECVRLNRSPEIERRAAEFVDENFRGFGPKQSRNLLQGLGLSCYEIPIDSRITKWLNKFGFPVELSANALGDTNYYSFVSTGFQRLCEAAEIMPCAMDAAIFSSFDSGMWTDENVVW